MCKAKRQGEFFLLSQPGDYAVEKDGAGITSNIVIACPSCSVPSELPASVISEDPLTLADSFTCLQCYASFFIHDGEIDPMAGTLPPSARWEGYKDFEDSKYR